MSPEEQWLVGYWRWRLLVLVLERCGLPVLPRWRRGMRAEVIDSASAPASARVRVWDGETDLQRWARSADERRALERAAMLECGGPLTAGFCPECEGEL